MPRRLFLLIVSIASCLLALVPAAADAATPGVNVVGNVGDPATINAALASGAHDVRLFGDWAGMEPGSASDFTVDAHGKINDNNLARGTLQAIKQIRDAGRTVTVVLTNSPGWSNGGQSIMHPPSDPATYASFAAEFARAAKAQGSPINNLEVWNEPEGSEFWLPGPDPAGYAALLKAAYPAVKAVSPETAVFVGPTVGNDYAWLQQLYDNGIKGSFDGVAVHTDTACLVNAPSDFYRENGRLAQFTFLGYREVRATMLANGDDKPIAMSELGWSSTGGTPNSCGRGAFAGQKPSGVTTVQQAAFLTQAYGCLANDPYVTTADWFAFSDTSHDTSSELGNYGLLDANGVPKPAYAAFVAIAAAGGGPALPCGDFDAPTIRVMHPSPGQQFSGKIDLQAAATDAGVGVARISFFVDGASSEIRNFTDDLSNDAPVGLAPWQNSGKLDLGPHTIRVVALDKNGNTSEVDVPVTKVAPGAVKATLTPSFKLKPVRCKHRQCSISGTLTKGGQAGTPSIGGKVAVAWEFRNKKGRWRKLVGGLKPANAAFSFRMKAKFAGRWRVRLAYAGSDAWKPLNSKYTTMRVR